MRSGATLVSASMLRALEQCTPGKVKSDIEDKEDLPSKTKTEEENVKKRADFDAANDKQILAKVSNASSSKGKLPPITDELVKQQDSTSKKQSKAKTCTGSLCPATRFFFRPMYVCHAGKITYIRVPATDCWLSGEITSSKGVSGYEQQANITSTVAADISRMLPTAGSHNRIGGKVIVGKAVTELF